MDWFLYNKDLRNERVEKTQSNDTLLWKTMSSRYFHHGKKLFIKANCTNNIKTGEKSVFTAANFEGL